MKWRTLALVSSLMAIGGGACGRDATAPPVTEDEAAIETTPPPSLLEQFWVNTYGEVGTPGAAAESLVEDPTDPAFTTSLGEVCIPRYEFDLAARAQPDECFHAICDPDNYQSFLDHYPGDIDVEACLAEQGHPKTNQAYVWGLTAAGNDVWFATAANVLCQVITSLAGPMQLQTDPMVCEAGCEGGELTDMRPPRFFRYDSRTGELEDMTADILAEDSELVEHTAGVRSAGSIRDVVFFGGLVGGIIENTRVVMYAFAADTHEYLGAYLFPENYTNIRQWIVAARDLYTGLGTTTGGEVLRWTGSLAAYRASGNLADLFEFELVGDLKGDPAYLTVHKDQLVVTTWGGYEGPPESALLYVSPRFGSDRKLTEADQAGWKVAWKMSDYEVEPLAYVLGGAVASYGPWVYWSTMQVPGMAPLFFCDTYRPYGACDTLEQTLAAFLGTLRPISVFRGRDLGTPAQKIELLYGLPLLPQYDVMKQSWRIVPNHMGGALPKFGLAGMNNPFNTYAWWMQRYHGRLFLGTFDWLYVFYSGIEYGLENYLPGGLPERLTRLAEPFFGADLFRFVSLDLPAIPTNINGLGNYLNYGIRTMVQAGNRLFLGTANPANMATNPEGGWELRELEIEDDCPEYPVP